MPELPEVETIRRGLERKILNKKIVAVEVSDKKIVKNLSADFCAELKNNQIIHIHRRGKLLAFELKNKRFLLAHLKMTGQLIYLSVIPAKAGIQSIVAGGHSLGKIDLQVPNKFTRVTFSFTGGGQLFFNDMRRFGYLKIVDTKEKDRIWKEDFGIEPLTPNFKYANFKKIFVNKKTNLKALLLNQKLIAGLGNIYADEVCWCAKVLPWRKVSSLKEADVKKLFTCIQNVIKVAVKNRGTTFNNFLDDDGKKGGHYQFLKVYERDGEKCKRCKTIIKKTRHAGRGTHYCPGCQK